MKPPELNLARRVSSLNIGIKDFFSKFFKLLRCAMQASLYCFLTVTALLEKSQGYLATAFLCLLCVAFSFDSLIISFREIIKYEKDKFELGDLYRSTSIFKLRK